MEIESEELMATIKRLKEKVYCLEVENEALFKDLKKARKLISLSNICTCHQGE